MESVGGYINGLCIIDRRFMKKVTNKELQKDVVSMYNATKQTVDNLLFTLWKYIEWKGDKESFLKFCNDLNKGFNKALYSINQGNPWKKFLLLKNYLHAN